MPKLLTPSHIFILLLLISFGSFTATLFTPALPELTRQFQISEAKAQLTMSLFLVGYAIGQLPYGPLANRYGRKKALFIGLGLAFIGTVLAYLAPSFWFLCLGRFIQALGAAVGLKITFTMVGDQHAGHSATRVLSLLALAFGIMPGVGAAVGGFITVIWGWRGCFALLAIYSILLGFICLALPETTHHRDPEALKIRKIVHNYGKQFKNPFTVLHALLLGAVTATFYIFATEAPYIGINGIGLSPDQFGLWNLVPSMGLGGGIILTQCTAGKLKPHRAMLLGITIFLAGVSAMTFYFSKPWISTLTLFLPIFFMRIGNSLTWANASSEGLSEATDKSNASAVTQFINLGIATLGTLLVGLFPSSYPLLLPAAFGTIGILMVILWLMILKQPQHA